MTRIIVILLGMGLLVGGYRFLAKGEGAQLGQKNGPVLDRSLAGPLAAAHLRPFKGWGDCTKCHETGIRGDKVLVGGVYVDRDEEQWILYREFSFWAEKDKHTQAFAVLSSEQSKKMGTLLKVAEIQRDKRCLACHTGYPLSQMPVDSADPNLAAAEVLKHRDISFGVTCEGCHGGSETNNPKGLKGWHGPHQESQTWRFLAPAKKAADYGFFDVRSPASRARICSSCHLGSVEEGRIVTHEMYAAGHPPLPGFELETFVEQMPAHWANFHDKRDEVVARFLKNTQDPIYKDGDYKKEHLHRTKALLVGALVSSSEYMNLIGQLSDDQVKTPVTRPDWPELAAFDCYACHHELKTPAWRQMRKAPVGTPGRPPLQDWNSALLQIVLKHTDGAALETQAKIKAVRDDVNRQPFGNKEALKVSTRALADRLWSIADQIQRYPITREKGLELQRDIVARASSETFLDYESARQLLWAFKVVDSELKNPSVTGLKDALVAMEKEMFIVDLRTGRKAVVAIPGDAQKRPVTEVDLHKVLPFTASYDPVKFRDRFAEIAKALK